MQIEKIKQELQSTLEEIKKVYAENDALSKPRNLNDGKYMQMINTKLRVILGNPKSNKIMTITEADDYYYNQKKGLSRVQDKYMLILELQEFITSETMLPFTYDRYLVCKLLQITLNTYNTYIEDANNNLNKNGLEEVGNVFLDIESMLLADRILSAENRIKDSGAIDRANKYRKQNGGFGVLAEKEKENKGKEIITVTAEDAQKKLSTFGFSQILIENTEKKKKSS